MLAAGETPPSRPWRSITFPSSDGRIVQGWLGLPDGEGPFPAILYAHGGPAAVVTECFSPETQTWLDHGFAYLTVNYRSSTTFGREFQEQIWGNPGHWEVEDVAAAHGWLMQEGIARQDDEVAGQIDPCPLVRCWSPGPTCPDRSVYRVPGADAPLCLPCREQTIKICYVELTTNLLPWLLQEDNPMMYDLARGDFPHAVCWG